MLIKLDTLLVQSMTKGGNLLLQDRRYPHAAFLLMKQIIYFEGY